jgi:putative transposase
VAIDGDPPRLASVRDAPAAISGDGSFGRLAKVFAKSGSAAKVKERLDRQKSGEKRGRRNGYPNKKAFARAPRPEIPAPGGRQDASGRKPAVNDVRGVPGVHEKLLSMYARGMSAREIQCHLFELYGIDFSRDSISMATGAVPAMIAEWQSRQLEASYPLVFFDALRVTIREEGMARSKSVHIALGIQADGAKDILGLWIEDSEGVGFWPKVMKELKRRGVDDVLIAVVDGVKGIPEAINAVFPRTIVQARIVHLIRHSMDFPSWAERKFLAEALKKIYQANDAETAVAALGAFAAGPWGGKYPAIAQDWRRSWEQVVPFFALPEAVRRIIYARNAVEGLDEKLRRAVRVRGHFPTDEAALFLILRNAAGERKMSPRDWLPAKIQLAAMFDERFVQA